LISNIPGQHSSVDPDFQRVGLLTADYADFRGLKELTKSTNEIVVPLVRADPKPDHKFPITTGQGTIVVADSDRPNIRPKRFELHRRMKGIAQPRLKLIARETLHMRG
jgi:hypothetical protein